VNRKGEIRSLVEYGIVFATVSFTFISAGQAEVTYLVVPPDKFGDYCYFNSGIYSVGSIFCVKANTTITCNAAKEKGTASWSTQSTDAACQPSTQLPPKR
jgi:hypothetical protein